MGAALGVAVVGSLLNSGLHGGIRTGFSAASQPAWWVVAGCGLAVLALGALTTGPRAEGSATRAARLFDDDERQQVAAAA